MQQSAQTAENLPAVFNDSLRLRAKQIRFRGVGNPFEFLDSIGLVPIKEFLYRGANMIDIADVVNLPLTLIHRWIEQNGYSAEIEEASVISAEGYIYKGEQLLQRAENKFELDKAKAMLEHGRFMASKKDKKRYGNQSDLLPPGTGVTYVFNISGEQRVETKVAEPEKEIIEAEYAEIPQVNLDLEFNIDALPKPEHVAKAKVESNIKAVEPQADTPRGVDTWEQ